MSFAIVRRSKSFHLLPAIVSMLIGCSASDAEPTDDPSTTGSGADPSSGGGGTIGGGGAGTDGVNSGFDAGTATGSGTTGSRGGATNGGATSGSGASTGAAATTSTGGVSSGSNGGATGSGASSGSGGAGGRTDGGTRSDDAGATPSDASISTVDAGTGTVRFIGRVDATNANAVKFAWSATGLVATVSGTKISVKLQSEGSAAFFQPVIDGAVKTRFQVMTGAPQTVLLGDGLSAGDHTVEVYRENEGNYGDTVFMGFVDGVVRGAPPSSRLIEVIGDSISAGYGNLGSEVHPPYTSGCTFSLDTQSAYQSYGAMLGRALGAEVSIIARSGWGMYRDLNGSTANVLPSIYENTLGSQNTPKWGFARKPDAVIINLGTNDSAQGDPGQPYEDAYVAFLRNVRSKYPNASIFLTIGPMTSDPVLGQMRTHLTHVVTTMNDAKISTLDIAVQNSAMTGCDFHPNVAEDELMAESLAPAIKTKLGW